jgi:hypothetical protein
MAHFYGVVSGRGRTTASRVGRKTTGLQTVAASWHGAVKVSLYERDGIDHALVELTGEHFWNSLLPFCYPIRWHGTESGRTRWYRCIELSR